MINILIADNHAILTEALVSLLRDTGEVNVIGTALNGQEALRLVEEHPDVDLLVLDIRMPVMGGIEALTELRRRGCAIPVLMMTDDDTSGTIARAMKAGASGYVLKSTLVGSEFLTAIRAVTSGGEHISKEARESLLTRPAINILILEDESIFLEALVMLLKDTGEVHVVGTASSGQELLGLVEEHPDVDMLLMDIQMPVMDGMDGVDTLKELRRRRCSIPALMMTTDLTGGTISRAMKAGAAGYVLKSDLKRDELLTAIRTIAAGGAHLSETAKNSLIAKLTGRQVSGEQPPLTRRELEVLKLIAAGKKTNEIAKELFISPYTAETHRRNLLQKLNLPNAAALSSYAVEHGLTGE